MRYCDKCKVNVIGTREYCPLCQMKLLREGRKEGDESFHNGDDDKEHEMTQETFPHIPTIYQRYQMVFRMLGFLSIAAIVISLTLNLLLRSKHWWSLFVIAGVSCFWVSFYVAFRKRKNIPKNILYQVVVLSVIVVLWDYMTGWRGWSIDFAIPIVCLSDLLVLYILSKIMHSDVEDFMIYTLIGSVFGITPIIFYVLGWLQVVFPSILCVASSVLFLAGVIIFQGDKMREELRRRLHY